LLLVVSKALKTMAAVMLSPCPADEEARTPDDSPDIEDVTINVYSERKYGGSHVLALQVLDLDKLVPKTNTLC
jgi:hypothetical protein